MENSNPTSSSKRETKFFSVPEGQISYDETPSGFNKDLPVILCIPGLGDMRTGFRHITSIFEGAGFRVVRMDIRGIGQTKGKFKDFSAKAVGQDAVSLIKHLDINSKTGVIVLGNSMAAAAAVWIGAEMPELAKALIFTGPFVRDHPLGLVLNGILRVMFSGFWGPLVWSLYYKSLFKKQPPKDLNTHSSIIKSNLWESHRLASLRGLLFASKSTCTARIPEVKCPILVVMGSKDPDFKNPKDEVTWIEGKFGSLAESVMIDGAGHYPHIEFPQEVFDEFMKFWKKRNSK